MQKDNNKEYTKCIVWNELIYHNGFNCICGSKLKDRTISKKDNEKLTVKKGKNLYCPKCNSKVGFLVWIPKEDVTGSLMGDYDEYLKKKYSTELMA